jgi:hypothetical protein
VHGFRNQLKFDFPTCEKLGVGSAFEDQHRFDADPDPDPDCVNDTGGKTAAGINYTDGKFATGIKDTDGKIQFNSTDFYWVFLTSNMRVNWLLFNHSIPLVSFLWPISYLSVHPSVDTFAPPY